MYLSGINEILQIVCDVTAVTTEPTYAFSWNDITATGMTLPQSTSTGSMTGATDVNAVLAPAASTNRQIIQGTIYNADTTDKLITVKKDVSGTDYTIVQILLAPGMTLHYSREHNWSVSGQKINLIKDYNVSIFTSNGTWTKPSGLKAAFIVCIGGAGGGGSGRTSASGTAAYGGAGGGSGAIATRFLLASDLSTSHVVTVGLGGLGGAAISAISTNGNNGANGGQTSFGALVLADRGFGGQGGFTTVSTGGNGGNSSATTPLYGPFSYNSGGGNGGKINTVATSALSMGGLTAIIGGNGGSGVSAGGTAATGTNTGSTTYYWGRTGAGAITGANGLNFLNTSLLLNPFLTIDVGIGGSGSGGIPTIPDGGNGGLYGAGGGGGSGVLNGSISGKGGDGAQGVCAVFEIF